MAKDDDLIVNVFIADEKISIRIQRDENQSDEEEITRRSAKGINDMVRELMMSNPKIDKTKALAVVALQLAINYDKNISSSEKELAAMVTSLENLRKNIEEEMLIINGN
ncbi:MAG: cell division protein ZapA [Flavobacteriales bacterium]|nr:cell division protein ZapA [Flavobacteriales bacterium]